MKQINTILVGAFGASGIELISKMSFGDWMQLTFQIVIFGITVYKLLKPKNKKS